MSRRSLSREPRMNYSLLLLQMVLNGSTTKTPLIFVLSPGVDPTAQVRRTQSGYDLLQQHPLDIVWYPRYSWRLRVSQLSSHQRLHHAPTVVKEIYFIYERNASCPQRSNQDACPARKPTPLSFANCFSLFGPPGPSSGGSTRDQDGKCCPGTGAGTSSYQDDRGWFEGRSLGLPG